LHESVSFSFRAWSVARKCVFLIFVHESVSSLIPCSELNTEVCHLFSFQILHGMLSFGVA